MLQESNNRELIVSVLFQLDIKAVELHKNGVKLKLQEQPFKVCVCSCGNPAKWFHVRKFAFPTALDTLAFLLFRLQRHGPTGTVVCRQPEYKNLWLGPRDLCRHLNKARAFTKLATDSATESDRKETGAI
jgi:hypothetical protein